ncbi:hypothetical protein [Citrobacter koseri]|uniref:hypothetical protein n=1 Tax=Citrobacter koseri TaxID=545 RepID=UPI00388FFF2B
MDARFWDEGLTAAMTDYNFSASHTRARGADPDGGAGSYFLSLNNGINLGAWQLRNFSTLTINTLTRSTDRTDTAVSRTTRNWNAINTLGSAAGGTGEGTADRGGRLHPVRCV